MGVAVVPEESRGHRRVRHEARDALAVVAFSAGAATALALVLTLLLTMVG